VPIVVLKKKREIQINSEKGGRKKKKCLLRGKKRNLGRGQVHLFVGVKTMSRQGSKKSKVGLSKGKNLSSGWD